MIKLKTLFFFGLYTLISETTQSNLKNRFLHLIVQFLGKIKGYLTHYDPREPRKKKKSKK